MYKNGELKVAIQMQSVELMLKNYLDAYNTLASVKTDDPPLFNAVSRSFQVLAVKYYKSVYNVGLICQKNWSDVAVAVAQEYVDCWLIPNFNYHDMIRPFLELHEWRTEKLLESLKSSKLFMIV